MSCGSQSGNPVTVCLCLTYTEKARKWDKLLIQCDGRDIKGENRREVENRVNQHAFFIIIYFSILGSWVWLWFQKKLYMGSYLMEGSGFTLWIANQPEIKKRTLQEHTLFRKTIPESVFDKKKKKKRWQFISIVLQIKQNWIHIETFLKTNFKMYQLASSFLWGDLFLVFQVPVT